MLAMLGVPPIMAVASPLPATIPSAAALLVVIALAIPTLIVHWSPGHIDRTVAAAFALGAVPGAFVAGRFAHVVEGPRIRRAFGWFLTVSGARSSSIGSPFVPKAVPAERRAPRSPGSPPGPRGAAPRPEPPRARAP